MVGEGWHTHFGAPHAEVHALAAAGDNARGATLYVTLEPCAHHGKTPPCTDAIRAAGIAHVVFAVADPDQSARGGAALLATHGIGTTKGILEHEARALNTAFLFVREHPSANRPFVTLKLAQTIDGATASRTHRSVWLSGPEARELVHHLRAGSDAIGIGIETALADDPELTVRFAPSPRRAPTRIAFDRRLRLPATSRLAQSARAVPLIVVGGAEARATPDERRRATALETLGAIVLRCGSLADALSQLRHLGVQHLLLEGGATLATAFAESNLLDEMVIIQVPVIAGRDGRRVFEHFGTQALTEAPPLTLLSTQRVGRDVVVTYRWPASGR
jgi:diaminohydroxyphosphoribosylaminopyrimidine deaminase/5-amino-6-(5-phosphoribosylamino)uracil reductase